MKKLIFYPQFIMRSEFVMKNSTPHFACSVGIVKHNVAQYDVVVFQRFNSTPREQFIVG